MSRSRIIARVRSGIRSRRKAAAVGGVTALVAAGLTVSAAPGAVASDWSRCVHGSRDRQAVFARAARISGVPQSVLLAVSYLESRWDDHGAHPSTSGGYGPMHLTVVDLAGLQRQAAKKGDPSARLPTRGGTLATAARLTGLSQRALRSDDVANVCGGAALLASYQPGTSSTRPTAWSKAVAKYSGATDQPGALRFTEQVFRVVRTGASRTTNDHQRVTLAPTPGATVDTAAVRSLGLLEPDDGVVDCPASLSCQSVPAPYEQYGQKGPGDYGNHDLADRPHHGPKIDYIVIHDTEGSYDSSVKLVQDPTYLGWNYTIRSSDGHVAEHLNNKNVGWHAGNWYVNMHSIGIEHEGYAAHGATWYTEAMYENSAALVRYLAHEYGVPLDRAHIIGHDQVPGTTPGTVQGMHWDPGPYWDWGHYMDLLGAPQPSPQGGAPVVTVEPDFAENPQPVTGCDSVGSGDPCPVQGTNFVYLHTAPSDGAPLVKDLGRHPDGSYSTTDVSDVGARAAAGQQLVVAKRSGDWLGVWYLGDIAWLKNKDAAGHPVVQPSGGRVVVAGGGAPVPVYGRAYPEPSAYPSSIPAQSVVPLQYSIKPGQAYVLADHDIQTDYYYAKTYQCAYVQDDCTDVVGKDRYYEIWFGHRVAYVRAADVTLRDAAAAVQP